jgi:hypothetical protein
LIRHHTEHTEPVPAPRDPPVGTVHRPNPDCRRNRPNSYANSNEGKRDMSDFTPQVETREIADSELDNVAGGVLGVDLNSTLAPVLNVADGIVPVSGVLSTVTGALPGQVTGPLGL